MFKKKEKSKKPILISRECYTRLNNGYRIIDYPLDLIGIVICLVGILLSAYLAIKYIGDLSFPKMTSSAMTNIIFGIIGLCGYLAIPIIHRYISIKKNPCSQALMSQRPLISVNPMASDYKKVAVFDKNNKPKDSYEPKGVWDLFMAGVYCIGAYAGIQVIIQLIGVLPIFEVVAFDVYAFFISSAIVEEMLFRGFLTMAFQLVFHYFIVGKFKKYDNPKSQFYQYEKSIHKKKIYIVNILASLTTGILFVAFHTRYWGNIIEMSVTILIGFSQALFLCWTKSLTVIMISHGLGNAMASRTFLQGLSSIMNPFKKLFNILKGCLIK